MQINKKYIVAKILSVMELIHRKNDDIINNLILQERMKKQTEIQTEKQEQTYLPISRINNDHSLNIPTQKYMMSHFDKTGNVCQRYYY